MPLRFKCCSTLLLVIAVVAAVGSAQNPQICQIYTTDADFDQGMLLNVNHDAPNNDQLQLNQAILTPFPFINVAASGRGTIVRIDVNTGDVLGEYFSAPNGMGRNPSRTTVDLDGNVWCGNRDEAGGGQGSVVKIGLIIGGTRTDAAGNPDPTGQYLAPPYLYNTCTDRDGDGLIKTSMGLGNVLPWNSGMAADDECIQLFVRTSGPNVRHVSVDSNNDVWVAGYPFTPTTFDKIDGQTGAILQSFPAPGCGGYGGLIDGNNVLWSATISQSCLLRRDLTTGTNMTIPVSLSYGLGIDQNGNIWNAMWTNGTVMKFDPAGNAFPGFPKPTGGSSSRGVAVTPDNNVWIANSGSANVTRMDNNGNIITLIPVGNTPTGVAVDANGKVWVTNFGSSNVMRIDPATNAVDLTVDLNAAGGLNATPYNYSDMTGTVVAGSTFPTGAWNVIYCGGAMDIDWDVISWTAQVFGDGALTVEARADNDPLALPAKPFVPVGNGMALPASLAGDCIEVRVTFQRATTGESPILEDLTIKGTPPECWLIANLAPANLPLPGYPQDVLLVSPNNLAAFPVALGNVPTFGLPGNASLAGIRVYWQVVMYNPVFDPVDPVKMSNGVETILDVGANTYGSNAMGMSLWSMQPPMLGGQIVLDFSIAGL